MKGNERISGTVIKRLPRYRRYLEELMHKKTGRISSGELSRLIGCTASQIRQDFNNFGGFGQQGYGYNIESLYQQINGILGLVREYKTVVIGAGNLGLAVANYIYTYEDGFTVAGMFDVRPEIINTSANGVRIRGVSEIDDFLAEKQIDIGIITTPSANAQQAADRLVKGGVKGIWNFAPVDLEIPEDVAVENVHISDSLLSLAYYVNKTQSQQDAEE
ncbi:MAG: redox-sensing transcriptional repressor Rex [Clostridiales Family XIII bacterium]|nr:redox-sensing transcriptional repressor Rex [Clostridiales Family XIII bacterium]